MDLAQAMEAAERNSKSLKGTEFAIRKLQGKPPPQLGCNNRVTNVGSQITHLRIVNSRTLNVMHVGRKATLPPPQFNELNIRNEPTQPVDELRNPSQPML